MTQTRIIVDPNQPSRKSPLLSVAGYDDATRIPCINEEVIVVQPYDNEPDFIGTGIVHSIDEQYELIYINVDWKSFHDDPEYKN